MIIIEDTRNQIGKHKRINDDFNMLGIPVLRSKLFVGDYSKVDNMSVCVDTKQNWIELAGNICGKQHERFRNECLRAQEAQIKLVVLIEDETPLALWQSPKKRNGKPICNVSNTVLLKAMKTMSDKYGVEFVNCNKSKTAETILQLLGGQDGKK